VARDRQQYKATDSFLFFSAFLFSSSFFHF